MNIVLIGYRGCGKSTIGKLLAGRLELAFVDTDEIIGERVGKTITEIFDQVGQAGFRELETAVVAAVAARDNAVIAAGGGVVLRPENIALLKRRGKLVWLQAPPEVLWQRIEADPRTARTRPNLTSAGGLAEIQRLLALRAPLYRQAADFTLDVSSLDVEHAALHLGRIWLSWTSAI